MAVGLIDLDAISTVHHIPRTTLRSWYQRGRITPNACDVKTRRLLFSLAELDEKIDRYRKR